jgi:hypothetical protein
MSEQVAAATTAARSWNAATLRCFARQTSVERILSFLRKIDACFRDSGV